MKKIVICFGMFLVLTLFAFYTTQAQAQEAEGVTEAGNNDGTAGAGTGGYITGSGTDDYVPLWSGTSALGDSVISQDGKDVGIGVKDISTISLGALFAGSQPKMEILTGNTTDAYEELVTLRHPVSDDRAKPRRLGFLMKLSNEDDTNESNKMGGMILDSEEGWANGPDLHLVTANQKRVTINNYGEVGIGVEDPTTKLDVDGQIRIRGGSPANGKVLTSDANGLATWKPAIQGTGTDGYIPRWNAASDLQDSVIYQKNGNVGIGTRTPNEKLDVNGSFRIKGNKPIFFRSYVNLGNDVQYNTGISTAQYICGIVGFAAKDGDINERSGSGEDIIKIFMYEDNGTWWIRANFKTHNKHENWDVHIMGVSKDMAEYR